MERREFFSSRWTLLLSTLGMAIGAGNIWRFPRLAGEYGAAFLIPWAIFLLLWSIPLIMVEFSLGKQTRKGPIGTFSLFLGRSYTWMGGFVAFCTMGIMFYYSVVTGWALKYFIASVTGSLLKVDQSVYWERFSTSGLEPLAFHLIALGLASLVIYQGVVRGIERANRILLPSLLVLLIVGVVRALTLPNAVQGLQYLFGLRWEDLANYQVWLEGLSQSAWSTGAGWGLILTYAVYMRQKEDVTLNAFITGFGNNSASLLAGLAIIPSVFALSATPEAALKALQSGNQGLTFIAIPQLFSTMVGAPVYMSIFFLALFFAALSSLISMFELSTRVFMDFGLPRRQALALVAVLTAVFGAPSALSMDFFNNQDWVWGLGLIISGGFFAFAVLKKGVQQFRERWLNIGESDLYIGPWFNWVMRYVIPLEALVLLGWWFYQAIQWEAALWWNPLRPFSLGTCLMQWGLLMTALWLFNRKLAKMIYRSED
ncbi:MAG: sodium-dependent transporter [Calditrichaeota bacterium]|nr:sodium-dependent transporter [Calditrichota bacterium]